MTNMKERNYHSIKYRRDLWRLFVGIDTADLGAAVEVGVAEGNFAEDILKWPVVFPTVYLVDRWRKVPNVKGDSALSQSWHDNNFSKVFNRTRRYWDRVKILRMDSADAARRVEDGSVSYINVDADHSYTGVKCDIANWFPKLKPGGVMSFHDYENGGYGVKQAVTEFAHETHRAIYLLPEDKQEDAGAYLIC